MPQSQLDSFLKEMIPPDSVQESLEFSIDSVKAVQKLSESQLPEPALWIVKMVQAAVASGSTGIEVTLGRNRLQMVFDTQLSQSAKEIFQLVHSGTLPKEPALLHLVTAIRASFSCPGTSFLLQLRDQTGTDIVAVSQGESVHSSDHRKTSAVKRLSFVVKRSYRLAALKKSLNKSASHALKGTALEHTELVKRCWVCPIPIRLDGRLLDRGYGSPLMQDPVDSTIKRSIYRRDQHLTPRLNSYVRYLEAEPGQVLLPVLGDDRKRQSFAFEGRTVRIRKPVCEDETFMLWNEAPERLGGVLVCQIGRGRQGLLCFVQDGIVIQKLSMRFLETRRKILGKTVVDPKVGGDCFILGVTQDELDLSQFQVRDAAKRRDEIMDKLLDPILECSDFYAESGVLKKYFYVPTYRKRAKFAVGFGAVAALPVGAAFGVPVLTGYLCYQGMFGAMPTLFNHVLTRALAKVAYKKLRAKAEAFRTERVEQDPV